MNWIQVLTDLAMLSNEELARLLDHSPDVADALRQAHENATLAIEEARALRQLGHEGDADV